MRKLKLKIAKKGKMKQRNRKKAFRCAHYHVKNDLVTTDPYDMYEYYEWCGIRNPNEEFSQMECANCKKFKLSRANIRETREIVKSLRKDYEQKMLRLEHLAYKKKHKNDTGWHPETLEDVGMSWQDFFTDLPF